MKRFNIWKFVFAIFWESTPLEGKSTSLGHQRGVVGKSSSRDHQKGAGGEVGRGGRKRSSGPPSRGKEEGKGSLQNSDALLL